MSQRSLFTRIARHPAFGGILLMMAAIAALMVANSSLAPAYQDFLGSYLRVTFDGEGLEKPLILWINDGLMAVFFFLIGLELKREIMEGKLRNPRDVLLPGAAAVGGMVVPALIYAWMNWGDPVGIRGWAIPAATDIAFALGILALVGTRAPASLKVFLLTLAILDDLGAILIIALFYTADLKVDYLMLAVLPLIGLIVLNLRGTHKIAPAILLGVIMWFFVLRSGVHATLAGVITAFCIPLYDRFGKSPLHSLEHGLEPYVNYGIIPIFAFANAGVVLTGISLADLAGPVPLGISSGLVLGKITGVFLTSFAIVSLGFARLPHGANWLHIFGVSALAGIGFTMSLFIGGLSFEAPELMNQVRLGVLSGSLVAAIVGFGVLFLAGNRKEPEHEEEAPEAEERPAPLEPMPAE